MRLLYWFRSLWANLVHRDRVEESLDDELRAYLDLLTADYERRGLAPDDARRAARVDVGGLAQVKESTRDARAGDALANGQRELRYTWRSLRRSPGFLVTVVLVIALGIGANATILGVIDDLLFRPPAHVKDPDRVVLLSMAMPRIASVSKRSTFRPIGRSAWNGGPLKSSRSPALRRCRCPSAAASMPRTCWRSHVPGTTGLVTRPDDRALARESGQESPQHAELIP